MNVISWNTLDFKQMQINTLVQNTAGKEIQIILPKDSCMDAHKAPHCISVQVLLGEIEFSVNQNTILLKTLDMINLEANILHSLRALENSIVRLSVSKIMP